MKRLALLAALALGCARDPLAPAPADAAPPCPELCFACAIDADRVVVCTADLTACAGIDCITCQGCSR